jgi:putative MATE family efflux protein
MVMSLIDIAMVGRWGISRSRPSAWRRSAIRSSSRWWEDRRGSARNRRQEKRRGFPEARCLPLNGGLFLALAIGVPVTAICYTFAPFFYSLLSSDPEVTRIGVPYLRMLYLAIPGWGMHMAFKGHWNGVEKSNVYMWIVLLMNVLHIAVNYVFIFGRFGVPAMGTTGAAFGSVSSLYAACLLNFVIVFLLHPRADGFLTARPDKGTLKRIIKLSMPATTQEIFYSGGYILLFFMVGRVGTSELAVMNVQLRTSMILLTVAASLGMASATLVSRTLGEGDPTGASQWGWDAGKLAVIVSLTMGLPLVIFPRQILSIFIHDPHVVELGIIPFQILEGFAGFGSLIWSSPIRFTASVTAAGREDLVLHAMALLPARGVWIVGPYLHYGLLEISYVQLAYGLLSTILITSIWADGKWKHVRI